MTRYPVQLCDVWSGGADNTRENDSGLSLLPPPFLVIGELPLQLHPFSTQVYIYIATKPLKGSTLSDVQCQRASTQRHEGKCARVKYHTTYYIKRKKNISCVPVSSLSPPVTRSIVNQASCDNIGRAFSPIYSW